MFSLLWEMIIGLVVGAVAKFLMPGKDPGGIWITMAIGIAGWILATTSARPSAGTRPDKAPVSSCPS